MEEAGHLSVSPILPPPSPATTSALPQDNDSGALASPNTLATSKMPANSYLSP
jgi:hypothetical protein